MQVVFNDSENKVVFSHSTKRCQL